ncbi:MAG: 23S rRNA (pseudouridine(1915)-N(3))-methyltransferase RlmH [Lysobacterales bacterium]
MRFRLIAVGSRQPAWVRDGFEEYARRLPPPFALDLVEIALAPRTGNVSARALEREGEGVLAAIPRGARVVALDERGTQWRSIELAQRVGEWQDSWREVALLIGGPDGHAPAVQARTDERWSLSSLTLPHGLARVLVAEQLYRAWSVRAGHPYHRE